MLTVPEQAVLYDKDRNASVWVPDPHGKDGHRIVKVKTGLRMAAAWRLPPPEAGRYRRPATDVVGFLPQPAEHWELGQHKSRESKALSAMENPMNLRPLLLTAVLSVTTVALADSTFDKTLNVSGQADLYVSTGSGNIHVSPGSGNQIHIVGHVHAGWSSFGDVNSRIQRIVDNPPIVQNGNTVRVGEVTDHSLFNNISIDYDVTVPADAALTCTAARGMSKPIM